MAAIIDQITALLDHVRSFGWIAVPVFIVLVCLVQMVAVPLSPFGILAGAVFGTPIGLMVMQLSTVLGALINFLFSRHVARGFLTEKLGRHAKFRVLDEAVSQGGWKIVALLRYVPIPFGVANYLFGLTGVPLRPYIIATAIAIVPTNLLFVMIGAAGKKAIDGDKSLVLLVIGAIAAMVAGWYVRRTALRILERQTAHVTQEDPANAI